MNHFITAIKDLPRWQNPTQPQLDEYNRTRNAYHDDIAKMLRVAFTPHEVIVPSGDALFWSLPQVRLIGGDPRGLFEVVQLKVTGDTNTFMRFTLTLGYSNKVWKQVKMVKNGDVWEVDGAKVQAAATALIEAYHAHFLYQAQTKAAEQKRANDQAEAFASLRPRIESLGLSFSEVKDTGGVILLTPDAYGPRLTVSGGTMGLKLAQYAQDTLTVHFDAVSFLAEAFKTNHALLNPFA
jgi:hypothetical protein